MPAERANIHPQKNYSDVFQRAEDKLREKGPLGLPFKQRQEISGLIDDLFMSCGNASKEHIAIAFAHIDSLLYTSFVYPGVNPEKHQEIILEKVMQRIGLIQQYIRYESTEFHASELIDSLYKYARSYRDILDAHVQKHIPILTKRFFTGDTTSGEVLSNFIAGNPERVYTILDEDKKLFYRQREWKPEFKALRSRVDPEHHWMMTFATTSHTLYKFNAFTEFFHSWYDNGEIVDVEDNTETLAWLMQQDPKAVSWLSKQRDIIHLGRYFPSNLLTLYTDRALLAKDCTVVYAVSSDKTDLQRDSATLNISSLLNRVREFQKQGWSVKAEVLEFDTLETLQRKIQVLSRTSRQLIIIYNDHGSRTEFNSSSPSPITKHQSSVLHPFYEKHAKHMPEVTCVLNSCSTGKRGGIAQTLSRTGISVFAPDDVCHLTELNLRNRDGKFFVSPTYSHDARTVHYLNGKEMFRKSAKEMPKTGLIYQYHE